jgi:hydrogenase expression/formation protein HypD
MKFFSEFRDERRAQALSKRIHKAVSRPWKVMEVCGGQTHSIMQYGIKDLLPDNVELVHGPGCPVCVTPIEVIDKAIAIASLPETIFCSFGDMLRVPGSDVDLLSVKARGGDVQIVYSPMDCLPLAKANSGKQVVFFAIGFETTAPPNAMAVLQAQKQGLENFSIICSHVLVPPVMESILSLEDTAVQAFLGPGHVCAVMGSLEYEPIARKFNVPIVISGFEPLDILEGIARAVDQLEAGKAEVEIQYSRAVSRGGNPVAKQVVAQIFEPCDRIWRGIGNVPLSGLKVRTQYERFDADARFTVPVAPGRNHEVCISGQILQGLKRPVDCPAFAKQCTPERPLGATMVSSEGTCAAYYRYGRAARSGEN